MYVERSICDLRWIITPANAGGIEETHEESHSG
jgi:hypothetical protein